MYPRTRRTGHFSTKLAETRVVIVRSEELEPPLHVPEVRRAEPLGVGELSLQDQAHLLDDPGASPLLGPSGDEVTAQPPALQRLHRFDIHGCADLGPTGTAFDLANPLRIVLIEHRIRRLHDSRHLSLLSSSRDVRPFQLIS